MTDALIASDAAHTVEALCPLCRIRVEVSITLQTLLKKTLDKTIIHITLLQETTLHQCGQLRVDDAIADHLGGLLFDRVTGEILDEAGS